MYSVVGCLHHLANGHASLSRPRTVSYYLRHFNSRAGGGTYSFVACVGHLGVDPTFILRRSTVGEVGWMRGGCAAPALSTATVNSVVVTVMMMPDTTMTT